MGSLVVYKILIDCFAEEEIVGEENARGEAIPQACFNTLGTGLFRAMYQAGHDDSISTQVTIAYIAADLLAAPRGTVVGQLDVTGFVLIAAAALGIETGQPPFIIELIAGINNAKIQLFVIIGNGLVVVVTDTGRQLVIEFVLYGETVCGWTLVVEIIATASSTIAAIADKALIARYSHIPFLFANLTAICLYGGVIAGVVVNLCTINAGVAYIAALQARLEMTEFQIHVLGTRPLSGHFPD